jgi:two-component sensor histidine kinase
MVPNDALISQNLDLKRLLKLAAADTAERDVADKIQRVLMEELHHRMKNMMAMVTAIVRQSLRTAVGLEEAGRAIERRLVAMSNAHDLLLKMDWNVAGLTNVIRCAIEQHNSVSGSSLFKATISRSSLPRSYP